jgi:hypothetical protein
MRSSKSWPPILLISPIGWASEARVGNCLLYPFRRCELDCDAPGNDARDGRDKEAEALGDILDRHGLLTGLAQHVLTTSHVTRLGQEPKSPTRDRIGHATASHGRDEVAAPEIG